MSAEPKRTPAAAMTEPILTCDALEIGYGRRLLPPIQLSVCQGQFLGVVGRNGAGKTTFFRTLLGLIPPLGGRVTLPPALPIAYVPQVSALDALLPIRSRDVVAWGTLRGWSFLRPGRARAARDARDRALREADAAILAGQAYGELSQGQKQRVLFARMLASDPRLAFLDEPTAAMDVVAERHAFEGLVRLVRERQLTVVVVTHDVELCAKHADQVLFLDREDQSVIQGDPETVFTHPEFVRHYGPVKVDRGR
jgi:zinc transport system ATP-binding protein